ncbi:hypothetical protein J6590_037142 [Homalodisca vitripennis]|nr:hypothetical protein J6590_037142 [Homalodisca vitripennis]
MVGPEPGCGIAFSNIKALVKDWEKRTRHNNGSRASGLRLSKLFTSPYVKATKRNEAGRMRWSAYTRRCRPPCQLMTNFLMIQRQRPTRRNKQEPPWGFTAPKDVFVSQHLKFNRL